MTERACASNGFRFRRGASPCSPAEVLCPGNPGARVRHGMTLIELVVVMAIISILVALSLPAISQVRATAKRVECTNNLRNIGLAMLQETESRNRFPAAGNFGRDPETGSTRNHHSWVVDVLPWLDQGNIAAKWDKDKPVDDAVNEPLTRIHIPVLTCPVDISCSTKRDQGDLSYVVNGGVGFTVEFEPGMHDCFVDPRFTRLDLNGNGALCPPRDRDRELDGQPSDREIAFWMGLFFNETWKWDVTRRHHRPATVRDGMSQTIMLSENVRTGYNPANPDAHWAHPNPYFTSFYVGNPCVTGNCLDGVDYSLTNSRRARINSGLWSAEGTSPVPNSFHAGGVNMAFCDGRVVFVSETIDGAVYASLASPAGLRLAETMLAQPVVSDADY